MIPKIVTRDFLLIFFAQLVFTSSFFALMPTIPIYLSRLGAGEAEIGVLVGVLIVTSLITRPFVGRALLRIQERKFLIAGSFVTAFCCVAYLIAKPFFPFFILRAIQGIGFAFFVTAGFTLAVNITPVAHHGEGISYFYIAGNLATALAPAFGILIINHFNFTALFLVCAALSLASLSLTLRLGKRQGVPVEAQAAKHQPILSREALPASIMGLISNNIWGSLNAFYPLFALSHGVSNPGLFFTVFAAILVLGRAFGGKILDLYRRERIIPPCLATQIIAMTTLAFSTTHPKFLLAAAIWGIGNVFLYPLMMAIAVDRAGTSRGPAIATFTALNDLGTGMGSVIMGIVVQWTSYRTMFLTLAFTSVVNLFYFNLFVKEKGAKRDAHL